MRGRRLVLISAAIAAVLLYSSATTAAPAPDIPALKEKLLDAMRLEEDAQEAANRSRWPSARALTAGSLAELREVERALGSHPAAKPVSEAIEADENAHQEMSASVIDDHFVDFELGRALNQKDKAWALLNEPQQALAQCVDGKDNDGDKIVDGRYDSGCSSSKDGTERSPFTCTLQTVPADGSATVKGSCSGPFEKLEILAPSGTRYDTMPVPRVTTAEQCRFATPERLECRMEDGVQNPRHSISVRLGFSRGSASSLRVRITDFAGRARTWTARAAASAPYLRFRLTYTHEGLSHVCVSIEATSGALVKLRLAGPNGQAAEGTVQLQRKPTRTTTGGFSFRILQFGSYRVTVIATSAGKSVTKAQTIAVGEAPGDPRCSATGAPPP